MNANIPQLEELTVQVRRDILRMVHAVNSGHPGGSLGCAEFFVAMYQHIMKRKGGFDMDGQDEDIFFETDFRPLIGQFNRYGVSIYLGFNHIHDGRHEHSSGFGKPVCIFFP